MTPASQRESCGRENSFFKTVYSDEGRASFESCFLELTRDGTLVVNREGRILDSNQAMSELMGYSKEELLTLSLEKLHPLPQYFRVTRVIEEIDQTGRGQLKETRLLTRQGRSIFVELWGQRVGASEESCYCLLYRDVSERREYETRQKRVEAQLRSVQKLESLGVLAKSTAHDFNNQLVGILGNAGLALLELSDSHPARHSIVEIEASALKATELTRQLLEYSNFDGGEPALVDVPELIAGIRYLLEVTVSKKVVVSCHIGTDTPRIRGKRSQLQQVVIELLTNASESVGDSIGEIEIRTGVLQAAELSAELLDRLGSDGFGDYLYLTVGDSGDGMSPETLSRIFEPSFSSKANGRGIGLAAVAGIVDSHQGCIDIQSAIGEGTQVRVVLPIGEVSLVNREVSDEELCGWTGSGTVLVVDDEETVRQVAKDTLERCGFDVVTAEDGEDAVEKFASCDDSLVAVLIDLTMPRLSGVEAVSRIRRVDQTVPVIVSSGYEKGDATRRFAGIGTAQFIQKPYQTKHLVREFYIATLPPAA